MEALALFIESFWGLIVAVVGAIFWLVRLEATNKYNTQKIKELEETMTRGTKEAKEHRIAIQSNIAQLRVELNKQYVEINKILIDIVYKIGDKKNRDD